MRKFTALVHYIIDQCSDNPTQLGTIRLNKALWYSDVTAYKHYGESITGERYVKRQFGPVPQHILRTLDELKRNGSISIERKSDLSGVDQFRSLAAPDASILSNQDKAIVSMVLDGVLGHTANEISEMSHDVVWEAAAEGEEMPLYATLASTPGEITADTVRWADELMSGRHGAS